MLSARPAPGQRSATPAADGFWMPGEFEPHSGCWMLWPQRPDNWREQALPAQQAFVQLAAAIAAFEPLTVGVAPRHLPFARAALLPRIRVVPLPSDDCWMRDVGPTVLVDQRGQTTDCLDGALDALAP